MSIRDLSYAGSNAQIYCEKLVSKTLDCEGVANLGDVILDDIQAASASVSGNVSANSLSLSNDIQCNNISAQGLIVANNVVSNLVLQANELDVSGDIALSGDNSKLSIPLNQYVYDLANGNSLNISGMNGEILFSNASIPNGGFIVIKLIPAVLLANSRIQVELGYKDGAEEGYTQLYARYGGIDGNLNAYNFSIINIGSAHSGDVRINYLIL